MSETQKNLNTGAEELFQHFLSPEQMGALELKWSALPSEVREVVGERHPDVKSPVVLYVLRQVEREANGKLASELRPIWKNSVKHNMRALTSTVENSRNEAFRRMGQIADEIPDVKESRKVLKAAKIELDMTTADPAIVAACKIFNISPASLK